MSFNTKTIKESFELVKPIAVEVVDYFYDYLFEHFSEAKPLFDKVNLPNQKKALTASLVHIVDHLDDLNGLVKYLKSMGARHNAYGVQDAHYAMIGRSLISTFKHFFAENWTSDLEDNWISAFELIATTMQTGAREAHQTKTHTAPNITPIRAAQDQPSAPDTISESMRTLAKKMARNALMQALEEELTSEIKALAKKKVQNLLMQALREEGDELQDKKSAI